MKRMGKQFTPLSNATPVLLITSVNNRFVSAINKYQDQLGMGMKNCKE
jgi:hypothetical protein